MINAAQLSTIAPTIRSQRAIIIADKLDNICPLYGITIDVFHEFIANVLVECSSFTVFTENLNYRAEALIEKFSRKRISIAQCNAYGRTSMHPADVQKIANTIYGGEWGKLNLGNIYPTDGWDLRGSGPIQITGRSNMTSFMQYYNNRFAKKLTILEIANLLRTDLDVGIHSACWFFAIAKHLITMSIDNQLKDIVKRINGGFNGMDERSDFYKLAVAAIV